MGGREPSVWASRIPEYEVASEMETKAGLDVIPGTPVWDVTIPNSNRGAQSLPFMFVKELK